MAFKNALKNLVAHFGSVWSLLLYLVIFAAFITGLSLFFILPIARAMGEAGVTDAVKSAFSSLFHDGGWNGLWDGLYSAYARAASLFENNSKMVSLTLTFLIIVVTLAFRFFLGLYEIPLAVVTDGAMSCNARYGLGGKFFSSLWLSVRYSFAKMLYTLVFDAAAGLIFYGLGVAIGASVALPFVLILTFVILWSFRFSVSACWAPIVVSGEYGVARGFFRSARICFIRFWSVFSTYFVSIILIFALGAFITVFTLGVGLIIVMPISATFICYLNATEFYNLTGRRYYVDGIVFTPPADNLV